MAGLRLPFNMSIGHCEQGRCVEGDRLQRPIARCGLQCAMREQLVGGPRPISFGEPKASGEDVEQRHFDDCSAQWIAGRVHKTRVKAEAHHSTWCRVRDPVVPHRSHPSGVAGWCRRLSHLRILKCDDATLSSRRVVTLVEPALEVGDPPPPILVLGARHEAEGIRRVLCIPPELQRHVCIEVWIDHHGRGEQVGDSHLQCAERRHQVAEGE